MATRRRRRRGARVEELPESWHWALALGGDAGIFGGEAERRRAWFTHSHLIETNPCTRAAGWWLYESPEPRNLAEPEHAQLERLGVLSAEERGHLEQWRQAGIFSERTER